MAFKAPSHCPNLFFPWADLALSWPRSKSFLLLCRLHHKTQTQTTNALMVVLPLTSSVPSFSTAAHPSACSASITDRWVPKSAGSSISLCLRMCKFFLLELSLLWSFPPFSRHSGQAGNGEEQGVPHQIDLTQTEYWLPSHPTCTTLTSYPPSGGSQLPPLAEGEDVPYLSWMSWGFSWLMERKYRDNA